MLMKIRTEPHDIQSSQSMQPSLLPNRSEDFVSESSTYRRSPKPRVIFEVSSTLLEQIREKAIAQGLTLTGYMMKLLAADGLDTISREPTVDGRTLRRQRARKSA